MEWQSDDKELKAAGAEFLGGGRVGIRLRGWEIDFFKRSILSSSLVQQWEEKLQTSHLPEMEALPPVEVPAAAKWKFRNKPTDQVILDYDYTFTTPYCGSTGIEMNPETGRRASEENNRCLHWEDCQEQVDMVALAAKEPFLFYDEIVLYEDELADNGISLLTVKVRVMPSGWFLLLRFWLRVDGVLMRLRDTRMHCIFRESTEPIVLRESCWREATFHALSSEMDTRYLVKVHSIEVSTLPISKAGSIVDLQCTSFCDVDTKNLVVEMSDLHAFLNLLEENKKTNFAFLKDVPVWGTCLLGFGCYLIVAVAARNPPSADTLSKIKRAAKALADMIHLVKDLADASYALDSGMSLNAVVVAMFKILMLVQLC